MRALADMVIRGISEKVLEHLGIFRRTVFAGVDPPDLVEMLAHHVQYRAAAYHRSKEIRPLRQRGPYQQTAVAGTPDRKLRRRGISICDQPFGGREEIVEDVLFALPALSCLWIRSRLLQFQPLGSTILQSVAYWTRPSLRATSRDLKLSQPVL
jgi:hypothetical protein